MIAVLTGHPDVGVGVVIGSNIWNIAGILGISALFAGIIKADQEEISRDGMMTLITSLILIFFMFFGKITKIASFLMIMAYIGYMWLVVKAQKGITNKNNKDKPKSFNYKTLLWTIIGLLGLAVGCRIMVYCAVELAKIVNIPKMLMGILLAFGTTAPEFFTVLTSALKGLNRLAIGTVLGSNIFNIMIGIGVPALFMTIPIKKIAVNFDAPAMIFVTLLVLVLMRRGMKLTRLDGLILVAFYMIYIGTRIYIST